nr:endoribonuclease dicer like 3a [Quercus suber]
MADCVEALIGAYYISGGIIAALHLMKWLGIDAELDPSLVVLSNYYCFSTEAITHASQQELGVGYCYQSYTDIDPGKLIDLRSASVNNESFAQAAVRLNLHQDLQHCSGLLLCQLTEYVKSISESHADGSLQGPKGPKALGDMVESIAGAILLDTKLNLNEVWRIYKPLLSPIVTPDKLELHPFRKMKELCASRGYFIKEKFIKKGDIVHAELSLQLKGVLLIGEGYEGEKKIARGEAACHLFKKLEERELGINKKRKSTEDQLTSESTSLSSPTNDCSNKDCSPDSGTPGDARADKKSALDSAALAMLYELERQGKLVVGGS